MIIDQPKLRRQLLKKTLAASYKNLHGEEKITFDTHRQMKQWKNIAKIVFHY